MFHLPLVGLASAALVVAGTLARAHAGSPDSSSEKGTTSPPAKTKLVPRVYPVAELIVLPDILSGPSGLMQRGATSPGSDLTGKNAIGPRQPDAARLIDLITGLIQPRTWSKHGGAGSIEYHPQVMALSVRQTPDIQEQVEELLTALRRLQEVNVGVEVRIFRVPDSFLERLDLDGAVGKGGKTTRSGSRELPAFHSDRQVGRFLEAVKADRRAALLQSPRLMGADGQVSTIGLTDRRLVVTQVEVARKNGQTLLQPRNETISTGFRLSVLPVVSADRRYVRLTLAFELANVDPGPMALFPIASSPAPATGEESKPVPATPQVQQPRTTTLTLQETMTIPDGSTVLLGGWSRRAKHAAGTEKGADTETIVLLLTPRIVIPEEEELRQSTPAPGDPGQHKGGSKDRKPPQSFRKTQGEP